MEFIRAILGSFGVCDYVDVTWYILVPSPHRLVPTPTMDNAFSPTRNLHPTA